jgi:excisionase family DNA binding protein
MARLTIPTCAQDRLRFSEALRLGDNSHRNRAADIHRLPQHRLGVGPLLDRRPWAHEHPLDCDPSETAQRCNRRTSMNDPAATIRVLYSVPEAMALLNLSRTQIYELIRTSRLVTVTQGRRRLVPADSITEYVQLLLAERGGSGHGRAA